MFPFLFFWLLFFTYQYNYFHTVDEGFFEEFQQDSESLVLGGIIADRIVLEKHGWNLGYVNFDHPDNVKTQYNFFSLEKSNSNFAFIPYKSQVGIQGSIYSLITKVLNVKSVEKLEFIPSAALALLVVFFHFLHAKIYGKTYAFLFSLTFIFSPWIIVFARNLYWSPFLWLLPTLLATYAFITKKTYIRKICYFFLFFFFFLKCLCGYEYITSLTLLACSPFIVGPFFNGKKRPDLKSAALIFLLCILGFASAFLIHANNRGQTIRDGAIAIYKEDVMRRTYSNPSNFDSIYADSLKSSPLIVLKKYIFDWDTPLFSWVTAKFFNILILLAFLDLAFKKKILDKTYLRDFALISFMSLIPLSWFILAKAHSYAHFSMNYVLWYLGFIPALLYVGINLFLILYVYCKHLYKNLIHKIFNL